MGQIVKESIIQPDNIRAEKIPIFPNESVYSWTISIRPNCSFQMLMGYSADSWKPCVVHTLMRNT